MASRRFVDRGFWKCRELNGCSVHARLLAIYLFSDEADDFGRIKDDPYRMQHGCFSDTKLAEGEVKDFVDELVDAGFIKRYFARGGRPLLWLPTFQQYQPRKYWATSYLDRHPDDDFEVVDTKMVDGRKLKQNRPLAPMGHVKGNCAFSPQSATTCANSPQVASPIPTPIPIPMSEPRRKTSRRVGNGVPLNDGTGTTDNIKPPEGVAAEDWRRLLRLTSEWPVAGKDGGLVKLETILRANGPKDAERWVRKADKGWRGGALSKVGKPGLPWAVLGKGYEPPDGGVADATPRKSGPVEALGGILKSTLTKKQDTADGTFERADNPEEASRIWRVVENVFDTWNGYDPAERPKATAEARGTMSTHDGRVKVLAAIFDAVTVTKDEPEKRWAAFRKKLKRRGGGSPEGRRWAKGITG